LPTSLGLDFLNSVATPVDVPVDWIGDGEGLLSWLEWSRLVPTGVLGAMRERAMPGELDHLAAQARSLRNGSGSSSASTKAVRWWPRILMNWSPEPVTRADEGVRENRRS